MMNCQDVRTSAHHTNTHGDNYVRRLVGEAHLWASFAQQHCTLSEKAVLRKALESLAFSLTRRLNAFAVPSKLCGTRDRQDALWALYELEVPLGERLRFGAEEKALPVLYGYTVLGQVQPKHAWLRPLIAFGATAHLLRVTGTDDPRKYYGCNVAYGHVGLAIRRLRKAGGDGTNGEAHLRIGREDVRLWRDARGIAQANVPHVVRHSPTGIEWGYLGSGPADLSLSVLCRFTSFEEASRCYQRFKADVIAGIPRRGGVLRAADVRAWLARQR